MMNQKVSQPSKEKIRNYMQDRGKSHKPPPSQDEIRRQLGWELIEMQRSDRFR